MWEVSFTQCNFVPLILFLHNNHKSTVLLVILSVTLRVLCCFLLLFKVPYLSFCHLILKQVGTAAYFDIIFKRVVDQKGLFEDILYICIENSLFVTDMTMCLAFWM